MKDLDLPNNVNTHVLAVNEAFRVKRQSDGKLFEAIYRARVDLTDPSDWNDFVAHVECDRSTINKAVTIAECDWISENAANIPTKWSTLHKIATIAKNDEAQLSRWLESDELNTRTTLSGLEALLTPSTPSVSTEPETPINDRKQSQNWLEEGQPKTCPTSTGLKALSASSFPCVSTEPEIRMNSGFFSTKQYEYVCQIMPHLEALGIKVTDTAQMSEEPEATNDPVVSEAAREEA